MPTPRGQAKVDRNVEVGIRHFLGRYADRLHSLCVEQGRKSLAALELPGGTETGRGAAALQITVLAFL
jgi:hypothetical protein